MLPRKLLVGSAALALAAGSAAMAVQAQAGGRATPSLSFFSGGAGAHADWLATADQPPGDADNQAIHLVTSNGAPSYSQGYAGITVHHVEGIPAASFPDSSFWVKYQNYTGPSLGSPRLVVQFATPAGTPDGDAQLFADMATGDWQQVSDVDNYTNSGWDIHSAACPYESHQHWNEAQSCHAGDVVSAVYMVADAYRISHLIDDLNVDNVNFSQAANNGTG